MNIPEVKDVESPEYVERENEIVRKRIERAWGCILNQFQKMASDTASEQGDGLSIFKFLPPSNTAKEHNCEYYWAERGSPPWNTMISGLNEREDFLKAYKPGQNYAICLSIPLHAIGDETIQNIKIFDITSSREIPW
jgi:hypothetical protein